LSAYRVFPVVEKIRTEIDFCFSQHYARVISRKQGDLGAWVEKGKLGDKVYKSWIRGGYRGPGELAIYATMLATHLTDSIEQREFLKKAQESIKLTRSNKKRGDEQKPKERFAHRYKNSLVMLIASVWMAIAYHKLGFAGQIVGAW